MRKCLAMLFLLIAAGCASDPFTRPPLPDLVNPDPKSIVEQFANSLPRQFTSEDNVVIQAPFGNQIAVLGVLKVDRDAGTFELIGLNPLGVKFFDIASNEHDSTIRFAIPPLLEHRDLLLSIAADIRLIYFNPTPESGLDVQIEPKIVRFSKNTSDGKLVYEFGDIPGVLLEKRMDALFGATWRVRYYQYAVQSGELFPHGIVMDNNRFHYRIIIKNSDWTSDP